ncbi:Lsr2 family protein [Nocardia brasiliensis]|uniref:Lsr2 family protein n=2 Tax=Nocardia brasiliensis TaxID=37326 RepID=A0A6G9XXE6_NOCBR|nr:Lsr2 family protein [Nocardia brasiliensis]
MARRIVEALVDDIDGSEADETVAFGFDGRMYEIDLSYANAARLREAVGMWADSARKLGRTSAHRDSTRRASANGQVAAIRSWAADNGYSVSGRGRISAEVVAAYRAAQASSAVPSPTRSKPDVPAFIEPGKKRGKGSAKKRTGRG